jgi:septal ring factor EnvC (AmiA/AmiB activator)
MSSADIAAVTAKFREVESQNANLRTQLSEKTERLSDLEAELSALKAETAERDKKNQVIVARNGRVPFPIPASLFPLASSHVLHVLC